MGQGVVTERPDLRPLRYSYALLVLTGLMLVACGEAPLGSLGDRSSGWITEPTVPPTVAPTTTLPGPVMASDLVWSNDEIENSALDDAEAARAAVFARREGDRFIQASGAEIAAILSGVRFPMTVPPGVGWVTSQLVFNNDGTIAADPSAAFGLWSAEPYSRSRSVAQMVVLRVATDPEGAAEVAAETTSSCARFSGSTTQQCELTDVGGKPTWILTENSGVTLVWFDSAYRYELFGRSFVSVAELLRMAENMTPLVDMQAATGVALAVDRRLSHLS